MANARLLVQVFVTACFAASAPSQAQSVMQPGAWEVQRTISAMESDSGAYKTVDQSTVKQCLSQAFLDQDPYLTPRLDKADVEKTKNTKCVTSDEKRTATTASWRMVCETGDGTKMDMTTVNTASAQQFSSVTQQTSTTKDRINHIRAETTATPIGACSAGMTKF